MSIWDIHYAALYASPIAVDAVLTVTCGDPPMALRAIDKTAGLVIEGNEAGRNRFSSEVQTVEPAAAVRATDLAGIDLADLRGASLEINGKTWTVRNHLLKPAPTGEGKGEVLLLLTELA
ncbi:hypothetical protein NKI61_20000 [Mesorhizobium sp. M0514]|uniref:hypothetical protein n=1 Tax=Mesorhizobium sp. M0514 TaxID=2956955 RepID=UPI00333A3701